MRNRMAEVIAARTGTDPSHLRNLLIAGVKKTLTSTTALQVRADQDVEAKAFPFVYKVRKELATPLPPN